MAQQIYNEGRVAGFSAWEIFARDALDHGIDPADIPDEHEWLLSMMGRGASMILKIPGGTGKGIFEQELPNGSTLTGAGVIIGSPFIGTCDFDDTSGFAKRVTSYGPLIRNTADSHPNASGSSVPASASEYNNYTNLVTEFVKINDGIVYTRYAKWMPNPSESVDPETGAPYMDIDPRYATSKTVVRLYISEDISADADINILLTGFDSKAFLSAISGWAKDNGEGEAVGGSTDITANGWKDGGFLGPSTTPWASKIIFTVPNSAYTLTNKITRTIPSDTSYGDLGHDTFTGDGDTITFTLTKTASNITSVSIDDVDVASYTFDKAQNQIIFTVAPENNSDIVVDYVAQLNIDGITIQNYLDYKMSTTPCIDLDSINLHDYYYEHGKLTNSTLFENIRDVNLGFTDSYNTLIAWYPGMSASQINTELDRATQTNANFFPPALYAAKVTKKGNMRFYPIDVAAPGTIKCFTTPEEAFNYTELLKDNFAIYYNPSNKTYSFVKKGDSDINNWYSTVKLTYLTAPVAQIATNAVTTRFVALTDSTGTPYNTAGTSPHPITSDAPRNLIWDDMLTALKDNKGINILGKRLTSLATELNSSNTIGVDTTNDRITEIGADKLTITSQGNSVSFTEVTRLGADLATMGEGTTIKAGTNFIEFTRTKTGGQKEQLRLYISTESPGTTNIPVGSIGIGW